VYLLVGADEKKMDRVKEGMLALTKGWERGQVEQIVREALTELDPYIYLEALDLMELHRALGRRVYLVSSSPEEVVRPLAERIGRVEMMATRARTDEEGRYTGELEFYCYGESKASAIRELAVEEGIDLGGSYAYSDSATDLPMLESVGHPVAVNPDRELRRIAEKRGWQIRDFRRPVRLRQHFPQVSGPGPAVAVATAAVAAALAWMLARRIAAQRRA
jgi:HAD superfamily hydrolase (TIGR01490 family)